MADVSERVDGRRRHRADRPRPAGAGGRGGGDRGQLILVTGLAVAVTLVALVLLLNTVIYTQNLATRGAGAEDGASVAYRSDVVDGVGELVDAENRAEYSNASNVRSNVTASVDRFDSFTSEYYARRGVIADVEGAWITPSNMTNGTLIRQTNASRNFTSVARDGDWTLVENASAGSGPGVRNFRMTVSRDALSESAGSAFAVRLDDGSNRWGVHVYDDGSAVAVAVENGSESSPHAVCRATGPEATVDLTAGTLNGTACPALVWARGVSAPYDVEFRNAGEVEGTYSLTVDDDGGNADVNDGKFAGPNDAPSPRAVPAVYDVTLEIHFETPNLAFHTSVRIARGEPR